METARTNDSTSNANVISDGSGALDPNARMPIPVMLIWVCAFAGLAAYAASWFVPSLAG